VPSRSGLLLVESDDQLGELHLRRDALFGLREVALPRLVSAGLPLLAIASARGSGESGTQRADVEEVGRSGLLGLGITLLDQGEDRLE